MDGARSIIMRLDDRFMAHINDVDPLKMILSCHQDIDLLLVYIINEVLIEDHYFDVQRTPFGLKVELGVAMGVLSRDCRNALLKLNAIRNGVAHEPDRQLTEKESRDFYNVFNTSMMKKLVLDRPFEYFESPLDCIRELIGLLFVSVSVQLERLLDRKLWDSAMHEEVTEVLKDSPVRTGQYRGNTMNRVRTRFERLKREAVVAEQSKPKDA